MYTNPVLFLCTIDHSSDSTESTRSQCNSPPKPDECSNSNSKFYSTENPKRNVMVLSWITATNNEGRFMFSINKRRYSASFLSPPDPLNADRTTIGVKFSLCVPVKGMEQLVLDVGSVSGQHGDKLQSLTCTETIQTLTKVDRNEQLSNRQKKKLKKDQLTKKGIPGLIPIPLGDSSPYTTLTETQSTSDLFAIKGTVAHMQCRTYGVMSTPPEHSSYSIDENHLLILAEVFDAYVKPSYWDDTKKLFCPQEEEVPPYLTFFGSQTFGYVTTQDS